MTNPKSDGAVIGRFWSKVNKTDECWLWTGATDGRYGQFWLEGRNVKAHRVALYLETGEWPRGSLRVCHHCDVPVCVRPDHLFFGTMSDNIKDAVNKGRVIPPGRIKSHCLRGHRLTPENRKAQRKNGRMGDCRECHNAAQRRRRLRTALGEDEGES